MSPQTWVAHYRIASKLGEGGMGAVYLATDTKLNREVAIKVLPDSFVSDPDRFARFAREAKVLASMNHPNIAAIYGVEDRALVLELVEGPTLAERIARGPIPLEEALPLIRQLADALEYAHEKGIVHRDLKPENVKITREGRLKVLDFGLAKAMASETASDPVSSATMTMRATSTATILGTAAYMAPEQARAQSTDKRADIWAFGVVVYEMLTGRALFHGPTVTDTLAQVLTKEPSFDAVDPRIRALLRRCLERDPRKRLRDIGDARLELEAPAFLSSAASVIPSRRRSEFLAWILAGVMAIIAGGMFAAYLRRPSAAGQVVRFSIPPPEKGAYNSWLSLSPDGRNLSFTATGADGVTRIWLRSLDSLEVRPVSGTEGSVTSFWSADSRYLVFPSAGKLKKIDVSGGPPQTLCDGVGILLGGSWNRDGVILFGSNNGSIMRVSSSGGVATPVTKIDETRDETNHTDPIFLPDGVHFLYFRRSSRVENNGVYAGSVNVQPESQPLKRLQATDFSYAYAPPRTGMTSSATGHLLFLRDETLVAQAFDQRSLAMTGEPVAIAENVGTSITRAFLSVSANGVLAYRVGDSVNTELNWYDRQGHALKHVGEPGEYYQDVALRGDGSAIASDRPSTGGNRQVWILQTAPERNARLTFLPDGARSPVWSPDGTHLAFSSIRRSTVYIKDAVDNTGERPIIKSGGIKLTNDWSRDGRFLLYTETGTSLDLFALPDPLVGVDRKPLPVADSGFNEKQGRFSPDSRWVAYASDASGTYEIYVRPFPPGSGRSGRSLVSLGGGSQPRWRADGKELYYLRGDDNLMAVDVRTEPTFQSFTPRLLFQTSSITMSSNALSRYDVSPDGKRFLVVNVAKSGGLSSAIVVLNWDAALNN